MVRARRGGRRKSQNSKASSNMKERLLQKRKAKEARKKLISLIIICLSISIAIAVPLGFLFGNLKLALGITVGLPCLVFSYVYPRPALWVFLIYMCFAGTITYWIGGGNVLFQVAKDVFYLPALVALIQECRRQRKPIIINSNLKLTFFLLAAVTLMTLFFVNGVQQVALPHCDSLSDYDRYLRTPDGSLILNPETGIVILTPCKQGIPFLQGILGMKVFVGYVPLIFCAYYLIEDKKQLVFLGRLLVVLAVVCCGLGVIQYLMLKVGICDGTRAAVGEDLFRATTGAKCLVGGSLLYSPSQGQIRLPGTFVSPWHWAWFLIANSFITFNVAFSDRSLFWRTAGLGGLVLVFINAVICGQRIALALVPVCVFISLILTGQIANLKRLIPIAALLGLILTTIALTNPAIVQERVDSFVARWNTAPPHQFIVKQMNFAVNNQKGILGRGLGKATNSTRVFGRTALVETYHPKLLYETGYPGLIAFIIFTTNIVIVTFKSYRSVKTPSIRSFGSGFWVFILIISFFPYWYPLDTDPVAVYYWFFTGVLLKLPKIDKEETTKKLQESIENKNRKSKRVMRKIA
ncbi:MAG: hormogonium polysaccharide biosynthesis protein HpsL [Crocosphaera sp.]|nr:hormogonium polysaccharide biosynthesis protein HpsL [Crocosphaera sp.]MDJ0649364.1 hormogonium polysaccharide biosynthesis protein HpsL [Xenococcaceae cyanobacterium MO_188.B19]